MTDKQRRLLNYLKKVLSDINTEIQESNNEDFDDAVFSIICDSQYFVDNKDYFSAAVDNIKVLESQNYN